MLSQINVSVLRAMRSVGGVRADGERETAWCELWGILSQ